MSYGKQVLEKMLSFFQSASSLRSLLFDNFPINLLDFPSALSSASSTDNNNTESEKELQLLHDLAFDAYEYDLDEKKPQIETTTFINYTAFESYDWAFSFRESTKSEDKLVLEVSVERIPKDCETNTHCFLSPNPSEMTLLHGDSSPRAGVMETAELISEEEQNMILAAIIASKENDFNHQIPGHVRDELEHAAMIAAMEESKELAERKSRSSSPIKSAPPVSTPTREAPTPSAFSASPTTPRSLKRTDSDIPWTASPGQRVPGESSDQQRFRELLQFHAIAAASVANASARTGFSNITGTEDDYDWVANK